MSSTMVLCFFEFLWNSMAHHLLDISISHLVKLKLAKISCFLFCNLRLFLRLVLPLMQSICQTGFVFLFARRFILINLFLGEFYWKGKIRYALKSNLIYYGTLLLIFGILIIYVAIDYKLDASNFKVNKRG